MNINPYLLARLYAIQAAFEESGYQSAFSMPNTSKPIAAAPKGPAIDWESLLKGEGDADQGGGGGGTIKGLRGKNAEAAKAAMRRLSRK